MRGWILRLAIPLGAIGCFAERERLDTPSISLALSATTVVQGGKIEGVVRGRDQSGIVSLRVVARSRFDTVRAFFDYGELVIIEQPFTLPVQDTIPPNTSVLVEALVSDDQDFLVTASDSVRIQPRS